MSDTIQNTLYYLPDRDLSSGQCYPPELNDGGLVYIYLLVLWENPLEE